MKIIAWSAITFSPSLVPSGAKRVVISTASTCAGNSYLVAKAFGCCFCTPSSSLLVLPRLRLIAVYSYVLCFLHKHHLSWKEGSFLTKLVSRDRRLRASSQLSIGCFHSILKYLAQSDQDLPCSWHFQTDCFREKSRDLFRSFVSGICQQSETICYQGTIVRWWGLTVELSFLLDYYLKVVAKIKSIKTKRNNGQVFSAHEKRGPKKVETSRLPIVNILFDDLLSSTLTTWENRSFVNQRTKKKRNSKIVNGLKNKTSYLQKCATLQNRHFSSSPFIGCDLYQLSSVPSAGR